MGAYAPDDARRRRAGYSRVSESFARMPPCCCADHGDRLPPRPTRAPMMSDQVDLKPYTDDVPTPPSPAFEPEGEIEVQRQMMDGACVKCWFYSIRALRRPGGQNKTRIWTRCRARYGGSGSCLSILGASWTCTQGCWRTWRWGLTGRRGRWAGHDGGWTVWGGGRATTVCACSIALRSC